ncbi:beta-phosphoglucomutase [Luteirhabdus pelagi]|uniref:beta-phosphoglucomutase n=1 Tax=Luteirhabdus pelagi TaxID=2792783 RepID=UPI0019394AB9|nr:beta-phosphoglucomutase [Luteirhabdus pelagi]
MQHKKGFIFDLDGVIVDTAKYHFLAWQKLAAGIGISFTEKENEQLKGVSRVRSLEKILEWGNTTLSEERFQELMDSKNTDYLSHIDTMSETEILPDVERVLRFLEDNEQPMALGSASKNARTILQKVKLIHRFQTIVDGTDVSKAKPNPEVFLKAAERLDIAPMDCIVFEDSVAGIEAANTAGMVSIGIGDPSVLNTADHVFSDFTQMNNEFLNKLIQQ